MAVGVEEIDHDNNNKPNTHHHHHNLLTFTKKKYPKTPLQTTSLTKLKQNFNINSYYDHFFSEAELINDWYELASDWFENDFYPTNDAEITVTFYSDGANIPGVFTGTGDSIVGSIGGIITGFAVNMGISLLDSSVQLNDESDYTFETDPNTLQSKLKFEKKPATRIVTGKALIELHDVDSIIHHANTARGEPTLYILDDRDDNTLKSLCVLGYIEKLTVPITSHTKNAYPIKIIGVS